MIKKMLSVIITFVMLVVMLSPGSAYAATNYKYIEVTRNNAPLRSNCYESADVVGRCSVGTVLCYVQVKTNAYFNKWYKVHYGNGYAWIYEENVRTHIHCYGAYDIDGIEYLVCSECGHVQFQTNPHVADYVNDKYLNASFGGALALPALDGPAPVGDIVALVVIACEIIAISGTLSKVDALLKEMPKQRYVFYEVERVNGTLTLKTGDDLSTMEAFARVLQKQDVWTRYQSDAYECAKMWPMGCYSEIDKVNGQPKAGYYYHYHLGRDVQHKVKGVGHIFYGTSHINNATPIWLFGGGSR